MCRMACLMVIVHCAGRGAMQLPSSHGLCCKCASSLLNKVASLSFILRPKGLQLSCSTWYQKSLKAQHAAGWSWTMPADSVYVRHSWLHCFDCMCCLQVVVQAAQVPKYEEPETLHLHKKPHEPQTAKSHDNDKHKRASNASRSHRQQDAAAIFGQLFHTESYKV